ncbi:MULTISPECIES: glycine zipper 2TM domain-containing protein [unclassified Polaromonas]|uniref:glycine zipper 2TM domain-containing protein n=1 Tax=unclassified Polaromonas TaxID=2638319 RepID=UPI001A2787BE|nr:MULTISPECIES: glycine zipper 2TM domain-containing protein [unclassified Polaromonas]MBG6071994.1 uncharacterized protein YcfJ [Polaromonas sp. CG_9.7]MBG6113996.1 uncharacterized protein YcfJ [Polaromonas sp. CG_9.2]MDH6184919.1 uncharacterized protein YcfJ [Polaromonas sp. CG_23.6]
MEINNPSNHIHPLMAGAAVSVILVSLLGIATMSGVLPNSHATAGAPTAVQTAPVATQALAAAPAPAPTQPVAPQVAAATAVHSEGTKHKTVMHHHSVQHAQVHAQPSQQFSQAPAYQQPAPAYQKAAPVAQNSPIGIGVGAVVGGLLGNQLGGGKGKTLATIAGAVGGGYVGNEIAKRNP